MTISSDDTVTDYLDGFQYKDGSISFFPHAEGYVNVIPCSECIVKYRFNYVFNYLDHLGNIRMSYTIDPEDAQQLSILDENHYYPFGLKHTNYNAGSKEFQKKEGFPELTELEEVVDYDDRVYKYKFVGQERQDELGLNWDSFRHRNYDYAIGRFMGIDPISEDYMSISNYQFAHNNPVWKIELEGLEGVTSNNTGDVINDEPSAVEKGLNWVGTAAMSAANSLFGTSNYISTVAPRETIQSQLNSENVHQTYNNIKSGITNAINNPVSTLTSLVEGAVQPLQDLASGIANGDAKKTGAAIIAVAPLFVVPEAFEGNAAKLESTGAKSISQQASELKGANGGKNSVTVKTGNGQVRYDLEGKAHNGVETPHKQTYKNNVVNEQVKSVTRHQRMRNR